MKHIILAVFVCAVAYAQLPKPGSGSGGGAGVGGSTTISAAAAGEQVVATGTDTTHAQKGLTAGTGIGLTADADDITFDVDTTFVNHTFVSASSTPSGNCTNGITYWVRKTTFGIWACNSDSNTYEQIYPVALIDPGSNGIAVRTALNTVTPRTITGTANEIGVANGDGVAGNPTLSIPSTVDFGSKTTLAHQRGTSLPGTCTVGESFQDTDATAASQWYLCTSTNTWTAQGGSGGNGQQLFINQAVTSKDITDPDYAALTGGTSAVFGNTTGRLTYFPIGATLGSCFVTTYGAQGGSGDSTFTIESASTSGSPLVPGAYSASTIVVTIPTSGAAGTYTSANTLAISAGNTVRWAITNLGGGNLSTAHFGCVGTF